MLRLGICDSSLSLENDNLGEDAVARFELAGSGPFQSTVADSEAIALERINAKQRRKLLLIGAREVDPIEASRRSRLVELHFTCEKQLRSVRCFDRRGRLAAFDVERDLDLTASTRPRSPASLQRARSFLPAGAVSSALNAQSRPRNPRLWSGRRLSRSSVENPSRTGGAVAGK